MRRCGGSRHVKNYQQLCRLITRIGQVVIHVGIETMGFFFTQDVFFLVHEKLHFSRNNINKFLTLVLIADPFVLRSGGNGDGKSHQVFIRFG